MSLRGLLARIGVALVTLVFVLVFNFFLIRAAGDPIQDLARNPRIDEELQQQIIKDRGLDQSQLVQFQRYVGDTLTGDLGTSFASNRPVIDELRAALPEHAHRHRLRDGAVRHHRLVDRAPSPAPDAGRSGTRPSRRGHSSSTPCPSSGSA